jgi:uncharacterized protein (TIGR02588 family)
MASAKTPPATARSRRSKAVAPRPVLQWMAAGVGLLITLAAGGIILAEAVQPARPAALTVRIERERRTPSGRILDIVVTNTGSETAAAVEVLGKVGGETGSVSLDYVPGDGQASASLAFSADAAGDPLLSVVGWSEP